jgi:hypothetical protein
MKILIYPTGHVFETSGPSIAVNGNEPLHELDADKLTESEIAELKATPQDKKLVDNLVDKSSV